MGHVILGLNSLLSHFSLLSTPGHQFFMCRANNVNFQPTQAVLEPKSDRVVSESDIRGHSNLPIYLKNYLKCPEVAFWSTLRVF